MKLLLGMKHKKLEETPLSTNFRMPGFVFGSSLDGEDAETFDKLQRMFRSLARMKSEKGAIVNLLEISDTMEELYSKSNRSAMMVSSEFWDYLRSKFVGGDAAKMRAAINLLDFLMKNAGTYPKNAHLIYYYTSKRRMLKTLARCARDLTRSGSVDTKLRLIGVDILGCLQTWGEAFASPQRRELYPFYETYKSLEEKYNVQFPFAPNDPHRVPLILGDISESERKLASQVVPDSEESFSGPHVDDSSMDTELGLNSADGATFIRSGVEAKRTPPQTADLLSFDDYPPGWQGEEAKEERPAAGSSLPAWYTDETPQQSLPTTPTHTTQEQQHYQHYQHQPQYQYQYQHQYQYPVQAPPHPQHGSPHLRHPQTQAVHPPPMLPPPASAAAPSVGPMWPAAPPQPPVPLLPGHAPLLTSGTTPPFGTTVTPATVATPSVGMYGAPQTQTLPITGVPALPSPEGVRTSSPIRRDNIDLLFPPPAASNADRELERMVADLFVEMTPAKRGQGQGQGQSISKPQQPQPPAWKGIPTPDSTPGTVTPIPSDVFDKAARSLKPPPSLPSTAAPPGEPEEGQPSQASGPSPRENPDRALMPSPSSTTTTEMKSAHTLLSSRASVTARAAAFQELADSQARSHHSRTSSVGSDSEGRARTSEDIDVVFFGNSRIVKPRAGTQEADSKAEADGAGSEA